MKRVCVPIALLVAINVLCSPANAHGKTSSAATPVTAARPMTSSATAIAKGEQASPLPRTMRIGVFVFDNFEPIDVWGFVQAFSISRHKGTGYDDPPPYPFEIVFISNETNPGTAGAVPKPVKSYNGPRVAPDVFRDDALSQNFDVVMIPGGAGTGDLLVHSEPAKVEALMTWVRAMDARVSIMASVCTGASILARSGLLDGQPAATNHTAFAWVSSFGPRVKWDKVSRWVDAGKHVTSAGTSAGTDMAFYLVERLKGKAVAEAAVLAAEYDWHRDPKGAIFYPRQADVPPAR